MTNAINNIQEQTILVVEDEGEIALVLNLVFSEKNLKLDYANNLLKAEEYLQAQQPSIILLDNKLPDGYGVDFIGFVKKKYPAIKIIMISGLGSARDVALENGADLFFEKPFTLTEIENAVNSFLN